MALSQMSRCAVNCFKQLSKGNLRNPPKILLGFMIMPVRNASCLEVTKNISLLSNEKKNSTITDFRLDQEQENPLVVLIAWLMANKKHTYKYSDIWLQKGFDVLLVNLSPWQFLWPIKGSQIVARDMLKFLDENKSYSQILLHGFSVGGYLWGEVMVQMAHNMDQYQQLLDRIVGQVWDSAADLSEIHKGVPAAVFPRNKVMANALGKYMLYHLKTFDKVATKHYVRSSQMFHTNIVKAPALFLLSKTDPIGAESSNLRVKENWESMGMQVAWKVFEKSPHVGHFRKYPKEYVAQLHGFLDTLNLNRQTQKQSETEDESKKVKVKI